MFFSLRNMFNSFFRIFFGHTLLPRLCKIYLALGILPLMSTGPLLLLNVYPIAPLKRFSVIYVVNEVSCCWLCFFLSCKL